MLKLHIYYVKKVIPHLLQVLRQNLIPISPKSPGYAQIEKINTRQHCYYDSGLIITTLTMIRSGQFY